MYIVPQSTPTPIMRIILFLDEINIAFCERATRNKPRYQIFSLFFFFFCYLANFFWHFETKKKDYDIMILCDYLWLFSRLFIGIRVRVHRAKYQLICSKPLINCQLIFLSFSSGFYFVNELPSNFCKVFQELAKWRPNYFKGSFLWFLKIAANFQRPKI